MVDTSGESNQVFIINACLLQLVTILRNCTFIYLQFERLGYGRPLIHLPVSLVYSAGSTKVKLKFTNNFFVCFANTTVSHILVFSSNFDGATACGSESYNGNSITSDKK